jgi:hypothetical protein
VLRLEARRSMQDQAWLCGKPAVHATEAPKRIVREGLDGLIPVAADVPGQREAARNELQGQPARQGHQTRSVSTGHLLAGELLHELM